ncbi:hypothetical protein WAI453_006962 [Rhynchosporium graminicola]|uniref:CFEM domain-containing protein n=1 Tax=Rhynchosporium graminicola TaxID=2792576 RepID=A0A1E1KTV0_9HELO|nr:uncharacterized protein RCO7_02108 [Rhynchosporium commune]
MKLYLLAAASALTSFVSAQGDGVPACAQPCVVKFTSGGGSSIAGCNRIDVACICSNKSFINDIACCLSDQCSKPEQDKAVTYALALCKANQVQDLPTSVSCNTAAPTATGTGSPTKPSAPTITGSPTKSTPTGANAAGATGSGKSSSAFAAPTHAAGLGAGVLGGLAAVLALL